MSTQLNSGRISQSRKNAILTFAGLTLLLAAFTLVRLSIAGNLGPTSFSLASVVYKSGFTQDLSILLLCCGMGSLFQALLGAPWFAGTLVFALVSWIASLVHATYFGFFRTRLDAWVVQAHLHDFGLVAGAGLKIGIQWQLITSAVLFVGAIVALWMGRGRSVPGAPRMAWYYRRGMAAALAVLLVCFGLMSKQVPVWKKWVHRDPSKGSFRHNIAGEHIIFAWYEQTLGVPEAFEADKKLLAGMDSPHDKIDAFAALDKAGAEKESTSQLRARLGLPKDGPVHVFLVFVESARGYEFNDPFLSRTVLPNMTGLIKSNGIYFEQAYSSSLEPGQTARGLHSTLCGRLPNIGGPAVFIAYNHIKVGCLPEVMGKGGYETISIQPFKKNYHNAMYFESLHGTQKFFDKEDVAVREPGMRQIAWGANEESYFRQAFQIAKEEVALGKPLFAHLRTNSTHYPFHVDTGMPLPAEVKAKIKDAEYRDYLTSYHYTDKALAGFVKDVLGSSFGDRSLVVVMGDHSLLRETVGARPLTDFQKREIQARIPLMVLTKNMPKPERIKRPVHQMDVSRTVAHIAGLAPHEDWLGAGLFGKRANAWVFASDHGVSYRTEDRLCLAGLRDGKRTTCLRIGMNEDPFLVSSPAEIPENPLQSKFYDEVIRADRYLIHHNQISRPGPKLSSGS